MAHHSSFPPSDDFLKMIGAIPRQSFGATGKFPLGKLTPDDEGELVLGITHTAGKVVLDFGKSVAWIGFTPEQAEQIADTLREHAAAVRAND